MASIPSMLQYLAARRGNGQLRPEEEYLLAMAERETPQGGFMPPGEPMQEDMLMAAGPRAADRFAQSEGSLANKMMLRRKAQEAMLEEEDMIAGDPYGGVSVQTRAAMDKLGRDNPQEFGDAVIGRKPAPKAKGYKAKTTVRGGPTSAQQEILIKMLEGRGMSREKAEARAKAYGK